jgi:hypothetical protein
MLPEFYKKHDLVMKKNAVRSCGYQPVSLKPFILSKGDPYASYQLRFSRVHSFMHWCICPLEYWRIEGAAAEKYETFTYSEASLKRSLTPFVKREGIPRLIYLYRLYNFLSEKDIYYGSKLRYFLHNQRECYHKEFTPTYIHTNLLKIKQNDISGTSSEWNQSLKTNPQYKDWLELGEQIDIELPECIFKMPEDYLKERWK